MTYNTGLLIRPNARQRLCLWPWSALLLAGVLGLMGCSSGSARPPRPASSLFEGDPHTVVLRVEESGGNALHLALSAPTLAIYGDGTAIGSRRYRGAVPDMVTTKVDRRVVDDAFQKLAATGAFTSKNPLGNFRIPDAGSTAVDVEASGRVVHLSYQGPLVVPDGEGDGVTNAQKKRRAALDSFLKTAESQLERHPRPWVPTGVVVRVNPAGADTRSVPTVPWPFASLATAGDCIVFSGGDASRLLEVLRNPALEHGAYWSSAGGEWDLRFSILLPTDRQDCS